MDTLVQFFDKSVSVSVPQEMRQSSGIEFICS